MCFCVCRTITKFTENYEFLDGKMVLTRICMVRRGIVKTKKDLVMGLYLAAVAKKTNSCRRRSNSLPVNSFVHHFRHK